MAAELVKRKEPLEADELMFLEQKARKERTNYYKVFQVLMLFSFVIPFAGAWHRAYDGAPNAFSPLKFFATAFVLLGISFVSTYGAYHRFLRKLLLDIRDRTKTIEISHVTRKLFVQSRGAYYFYIDSHVKMSIEVSLEAYLLMDVGDEVCIEYTTHAREYLGYF